MQDAQDSDHSAPNTVGRDIGRAADDEFARSFDPAGTATFRKGQQHLHMLLDALVERDGGTRIVGCDKVEDALAIGDRERALFEPHTLASGVRARAARRFSAKRALTSA